MSPRTVAILFAAALGACSPAPPPAPPPARAEPTWAGREPASPAGTEGLRAAPCAGGLDLARAGAEQRAFSPGSRSIEGRVTLPLPSPASGARHVWSSSRPLALRFEEDASGAVTLLAGEPGATLARLGEEASILVSVPQFVRVRADADFEVMLARTLGLAGRERALIAEAKRALDAIYERVNLRVVWSVALGEELPPQLSPGGFAAGHFIEATLHGDPHRCVTPRSSLTYTEFGGYAEGEIGRRLLSAPVHVCPAIFARRPDTMDQLVRSRARLLADERSAAIYVSIVGRAIGELLAHEIGHQLLGCDTRREQRHRYRRCHDLLPGNLMNKAGERSFTARTGVRIVPTAYASLWRDDFPAPGTYEDRGVAAINRLPEDAQAILDRILPVPPALAEERPCAAR